MASLTSSSTVICDRPGFFLGSSTDENPKKDHSRDALRDEKIRALRLALETQLTFPGPCGGSLSSTYSRPSSGGYTPPSNLESGPNSVFASNASSNRGSNQPSRCSSAMEFRDPCSEPNVNVLRREISFTTRVPLPSKDEVAKFFTSKLFTLSALDYSAQIGVDAERVYNFQALAKTRLNLNEWSQEVTQRLCRMKPCAKEETSVLIRIDRRVFGSFWYPVTIYLQTYQLA